MASKAREIILKYSTHNIEKALKAMRATHKSARDVVRQISDVRVRRREMARLKSEQLEERGALLTERKARKGRAAFRRRVDRLGARGFAGELGGDAADQGRKIKERLDEARSIAGGSLESIASAARRMSGPLGLILAAAHVASLVLKPVFEKAMEEQRIADEAAIDVRIKRAIEDYDVASRLRKEPRFAQERAQSFARETQFLGERQVHRSAGLQELF